MGVATGERVHQPANHCEVGGIGGCREVLNEFEGGEDYFDLRGAVGVASRESGGEVRVFKRRTATLAEPRDHGFEFVWGCDVAEGEHGELGQVCAGKNPALFPVVESFGFGFEDRVSVEEVRCDFAGLELVGVAPH